MYRPTCNIVFQLLTLLFRIREVPGSNLGPETGYPEISWFYSVPLGQPLSICLLCRNPWNNFQVSGNPCIKIIISTAHGTLAWSVSCRYNNPIIIVNGLLSRELYFSVDLFILPTSSKNDVYFFFQSRSLAEALATSRGTPVKKPCSRSCTMRLTEEKR
jgi:hypothetical protein